MTGIMDRIIADKREEVRLDKAHFPIHEVDASARDYEKALRAGGLSLIAEIKPKSPSLGMIREGLQVHDIVDIYEQHAQCISVLTDSKYFGGSLRLMEAVSRQTCLPVLRKDFIIDDYQIYQARKYGAHAVLLIVSLLSDEELARFLRIARSLKMACQVEVHTREEMGRAIAAGATIIAINNRNLKTMEVDLSVTEKLASIVPEGVLVVSESGISSSEDVARMRSCAHAVHIGAAFMREDDIGAAVARIMGPPGRFGDFGGMFVPEMLVPALREVEVAFNECKKDASFTAELGVLLRDFAGRPTPLYEAKGLSARKGCRVYLKREDLLHTGAHKINNTLGQALLAKRMGKTEIIAETGAGQHGVATAVAGALVGIKVKVFMGEIDIERQALNVYRMRLFGAEVVPAKTGSRTLKDAVNEALRYYIGHADTAYYLIGSVVGPHPYPTMVQHFHKVIGRETRAQVVEQCGKLPTEVVACVGGGSNAIGIFDAFLGDDAVRLVGVEAGGDARGHGKTLGSGSVGVFQGSRSYVLQDGDGQITEAHSVSAGLDYPGVGPVHSYLKESDRGTYVSATDEEALEALHILCRYEGILPALESSHALAHVLRSSYSADDVVVVNLSGRGDKDVEQIKEVGA